LKSVTNRPGSALALIIDRDLGFMMWLGEIFAELGLQTAPALHCRQALALADDFAQPVAVVVVNPKLPGSLRMLKKLAGANPNLRIILIRDSLHDALPSGMPAHRTLERPSSPKALSRLDWSAKIHRLLADDAMGHHA
jgi:hypothetical protein